MFTILHVFLQAILDTISSAFFDKYKDTKIIHRSAHFLIINKTYDIKINSNNKNEKTVQTYITKELPLLASKHLHHGYHFMHRLDYSTSGIICVPIHKEACQVASKAIETHQCKKYYVALIRGYVSLQLLDLVLSIGRDDKVTEIEKMRVSNEGTSRQARTLILVLEKGLFDNYPATKVLIRTITGRRHQIRVHCNHIGHTIIGDYTYSNRKDIAPKRMFLHAVKLVIHNEIENIDIETHDPFSEKLIPQWKSCQKLSTFQQAMDKIDIASTRINK